MLCRSFRFIFAALLVLAFSSAALALLPEDAISARPAESVYTVIRIDDLNGLLRKVFSPVNVETVASYLKLEKSEAVELVSYFASQIPVRTMIIAFGITADKEPFMQIAMSMPPSNSPMLAKVADGIGSGAEIAALLLGGCGFMFESAIAPEVHSGDSGKYYTALDGLVVYAAKGDLLLIASSLAELEASIDALENKEKRLSLKRRFDIPNYWHMHIDVPTTAALINEAAGSGPDEPDSFAKLFKAPLKSEVAFASMPDSFTVSAAVNILESMTGPVRGKDKKPVEDTNLLLVGGGKLLFAISSPMSFSAADHKTNSGDAEEWSKFIKDLEEMNISERDLEDLLNGSFSIAFGSDASILGQPVPGGYIAFTGREGAAAKILKNLVNSEEFAKAVPMVHLKIEGWDSVFAVDQEEYPASLLFGVMKDTLFMGFVDADALTKTPELPDDITKVFDDPNFGIGVIDTTAIWD